MKQSVSRHETKSFKRLKLFETLNDPDSVYFPNNG